MLQLATEQLDSATPASRRMLFLHGILGRGVNLRLLARRFLQNHPGWDALLLDLRGHGRSPKSSPEPTLVACAADLKRVCEASAVPVTAVVGHSFGGKVALEVLRQWPQLQHVVSLDSNPGPSAPMTTPDSPSSVLALLQTLPTEYQNRTAFQESLTASGLSLPMAQWLAMSVEPTATGGVRFALDLNEIRALLRDYQTSDYWPVVQQPGRTQVHLVIAEHSTAYTVADRNRARQLATIQPNISVDFLPTGHMIHNEDLEGVLKILTHRLG
jgi:esterase